MKRKIVKKDQEKCDGCGLCVDACQEGTLKLVGGKAVLVSDSYCDGLGACLPQCLAGAITIEESEASPHTEETTRQESRVSQAKALPDCNCEVTCAISNVGEHSVNAPVRPEYLPSRLRQWPCQLKLVPPSAPFFENAHLLIAADCTAFAHAGMHHQFMRNRITLIGCPKLDDIDYSKKLTDILRQHEIKSITVVRMEVPCCGGIVQAVKNALINNGKVIPRSVVTLSIKGEILEGACLKKAFSSTQLLVGMIKSGLSCS